MDKGERVGMKLRFIVPFDRDDDDTERQCGHEVELVNYAADLTVSVKCTRTPHTDSRHEVRGKAYRPVGETSVMDMDIKMEWW